MILELLVVMCKEHSRLVNCSTTDEHVNWSISLFSYFDNLFYFFCLELRDVTLKGSDERYVVLIV